MNTAIEQLAEADKTDGICYRHCLWGPEGAKMSEEERAEFLLKFREQIAVDSLNIVEITVSQLTMIADGLEKAINLVKMNAYEFVNMNPEMRQLRSEIASILEFPSLFAEQNLPLNIQKERRKIRIDKLNEQRNKN